MRSRVCTRRATTFCDGATPASIGGVAPSTQPRRPLITRGKLGGNRTGSHQAWCSVLRRTASRSRSRRYVDAKIRSPPLLLASVLVMDSWAPFGGEPRLRERRELPLERVEGLAEGVVGVLQRQWWLSMSRPARVRSRHCPVGLSSPLGLSPEAVIGRVARAPRDVPHCCEGKPGSSSAPLRRSGTSSW